MNLGRCAVAVAGALLVWGAAACYSPNLGNGDVACGPEGQCPPGQQCASDGRCYKSGGPDDDGGTGIDAGAPDAPVAPAAPGSSEITNSGATISGGTFTMDVQVGHPVSQQPASGGGKTIEGAASVKP